MPSELFLVMLQVSWKVKFATDDKVRRYSSIFIHLTHLTYFFSNSSRIRALLKSLGETRLLLRPHDVSISVTVTTTLAEHHRRTILLGHSLESDLRALQLSHPRCIDTALIFHHPRGRPLRPGLVWLARKWLGRTIQDRGPGGHDPRRGCGGLCGAEIKNGAYPSRRVAASES